ncbi:MAG: flagellar basal body rod protein FlgB [Porticoccus sp.]|nr:flagellar basal body rod protein FlgB [Porticoccus sp.]PCJ91464.1 MAG: flagellar basal body rod protein FlgB [Porticoccaceae bacterium]
MAMGLIDRALGMSPQALSILSKRSELIAANLANSDTPGYKARDIDFRDALATARGEQSGFAVTNKMHLGANNFEGSMRYRIPSQPSLDGNTVETDVEHAAFMENSIRYQASLNFVDGRIKSILLALRGE